MSEILDPCMEVLPAAQRALWPELRCAPDLGFVLYGGTAIALRLGHRSSVDFDFFSSDSLDREALWERFAFLQESTILQDQPDTLTALVKLRDESGQESSVKVSFFGGIGFGRISEPSSTRDDVLQVASVDDLMATKLKVLLQRVEAKDYQDVAAMVAAGGDLSRGLAGARALYGPNFQPSECLKALVYFKGGDLETLSPADKEILVQAVSAVGDFPEIELDGQYLAVARGRRDAASAPPREDEGGGPKP